MNHRSYYLELCSRAVFRSKPFRRSGVLLARALAGDSVRCGRLWKEVGAGFWSERHDWTKVRWEQYLGESRVAFWIAGLDGEDIGFFELTTDGAEVKIEGFGLLPIARGQGLGAGLLSAATECALSSGAARVWLHTATDDHPHALPNYLARGYEVYGEQPLSDPLR